MMVVLCVVLLCCRVAPACNINTLCTATVAGLNQVEAGEIVLQVHSMAFSASAKTSFIQSISTLLTLPARLEHTQCNCAWQLLICACLSAACPTHVGDMMQYSSTSVQPQCLPWSVQQQLSSNQPGLLMIPPLIPDPSTALLSSVLGQLIP